MKKHSLLTLLALAGAMAIPLEIYAQNEVIQAAKKLEQAGGYTWKATTEGSRFASGPTIGKVDKNGIAYVTVTRRNWSGSSFSCSICRAFSRMVMFMTAPFMDKFFCYCLVIHISRPALNVKGGRRFQGKYANHISVIVSFGWPSP